MTKLFGTMWGAVFVSAHGFADLYPEFLRCEYLVNPLAVDVPRPRLSWVPRSERRAERQTAYRILVASSAELLEQDKGDLWDTGKVTSDETAQVPYGGPPLPPGADCWWKARVWDTADTPSPWSETARWRTGLLENRHWTAQWIEWPDEVADRQPASMFRGSFFAKGSVRRATAYVSALGVYELWINGKRAGDQLLAPEWTDYRVRVQYQALDVTDFVTPGQNAVGALAGDGWYAGRIGLATIVKDGPTWGIYGRNPKFILQLEIEYEDGSRQRVITDASWRATKDGPIRFSDLLDGEAQDARYAMPGWAEPGFDDTAWRHVAARPVGEEPALVAQRNEPIRVVAELHPVAVAEPVPGTYVYDLGQNMVGWCRFTAAAPAGTTVRLRHGEALNPDGTLYTANLRGARQTDTYTFGSGVSETFEPRFTYHGFRYVEITGITERPDRNALIGRVFCSSSPQVGGFACSSDLLNKLYSNILWTQRANMMSVPTDCPQRDERLGWMGDIQVFAQTAIFNMDMAAFLTKWLQDVRDDQAADGRFPDFAPHPFDPDARFSGAPGWGDAGVIVPWRLYENYGDIRVLEDHFEAARRWVDYVHRANPDLIWNAGRNNDYNDWLNGDTLKADNWPTAGGAVPPDVFATAFFAHSTELVSRMARVLGQNDVAARYERLAADVKAAFREAFVTTSGRIKGDTQAGYALALNFDLLPDDLREKAVSDLLAALVRYDGRPSTGIQTTSRMMLELSRAGYDDIAHKLIGSRAFPSWGYSIDQGATTIWERWDGYVAGRGFQDPGMNSLNHWAFGAIGEWMYRTILGINSDAPGFRRIVIRPKPGALEWAKGYYHSIRGRISVDWKRANGVFSLQVSLPPNASAIVHLPAASIDDVLEGGRPVREIAEIKSAPNGFAGEQIVEINSGTYSFTAKEA